MSRFLMITILSMGALCLVSAALTYRLMTDRVSAAGDDSGDSLAWIRHEFSLSAEQLQKIEALHKAFEGVCAQHCQAIQNARAELVQLQENSVESAVLQAGIERLQALDRVCRESLNQHFSEVAAIMGEGEGERYLRWVLPRIATFDHGGAPDLQVQSASLPEPQCHVQP